MTESSTRHFCSHCGNQIDRDAGVCPNCKAPTHFQGKDWQQKTARNFMLFFTALVIFAFLMMFMLPR